MSKRKRLRDSLYNYSYPQITSLVAAKEEEREKIARELHDSVGQELAVLTIEIESVLGNCRRLADNAAIRDTCETLQHAYDRIRGLTTQVGHLSHLLHPSTLQQAGLRLALTRLCREMQTLTEMRVNCKCPHVLPRMSFDVCLCIYRITQEALHNVFKHARASRVEVILSHSATAMDLRIKDNGRGFDPSEPRAREGVGLRSMAERTRSLGGQFLLTTKIGDGTQIMARLPTRG